MITGISPRENRRSRPRPPSLPTRSRFLSFRKQGLSFHLAVFHPYRALPALVEGARLRAKAAGIPPQPDRIMALHDGTRAALDDILVRGGGASFVVTREHATRSMRRHNSAVDFLPHHISRLQCECRRLGSVVRVSDLRQHAVGDQVARMYQESKLRCSTLSLR